MKPKKIMLISLGVSGITGAFTAYAAGSKLLGGILIGFAAISSFIFTFLLCLLFNFTNRKFKKRTARVINTLFILMIMASLLWYFRYKFL